MLHRSSCEDKLEHIKDIHNNLSSICMDSSLEGLKYYGGPFEVKCPVENCSQCILPYVCYGREEIKDVVTCIECKQTTDVRSKVKAYYALVIYINYPLNYF